ncbi:PAS domain-containing protein [Podospora fimiseda]|uniref:PAS domain-containing protein n=1 Tax=Podospora fimiseda TaxID=252190 RepID=A0AAN7BTN7_9PEZI|nr:PAS domain-containing protein [Podospora fimiseda]
MNPWEGPALEAQYRYGDAYDPTGIIYEGLYSSSGLDVMQILLSLHQRPNPQVEIGAVDMSCPIIICALDQKDQPIIYASPSFLELTGYNMHEVLNRNCRFLQGPPREHVKPKSARKHVDEKTIKKMRKAVDRNQELQIKVTNFKKNGQKFTNYLTMIPIQWKSHEFNLSIGLQCEYVE